MKSYNKKRKINLNDYTHTYNFICPRNKLKLERERDRVLFIVGLRLIVCMKELGLKGFALRGGLSKGS